MIYMVKMDLSFNYGFLGLGLGGTSIAAACADLSAGENEYPYTALLVNTNKQDLDKVKTSNSKIKKELIGDGKGAGRDITIGESIFVKNKDEILNLMKTNFEKTEFIWISAGLGGGSGTGAVIQAIGLCLEMRKPFGLILTLPRENERSTVNSNALKRLNKIYAAMDKLGPIILVDNEKLFTEFMTNNPNGSLEEYLAFSNEYVAKAIHDKNIITANFDVYGSTNFDSSELGKMLRTPGVFHFARMEMAVDEFKELEDLKNMENQQAKFITNLHTQIEDGVLSSGYDFKKTKRAAISVLCHEQDAKNLFNGVMTNQLEKLLLEVAPYATESPVSFHTYSKTQFENVKNEENKRPVYFYVMLAGLDLPAERIKQMIELDKKATESIQTSSSNLFESYEESTSSDNNSTLTLDSIFGRENNVVENDKENLFQTLGLV
jgi:tubulin-like protein CetZ